MRKRLEENNKFAAMEIVERKDYLKRKKEDTGRRQKRSWRK